MAGIYFSKEKGAFLTAPFLPARFIFPFLP
jgi:hypothetical protein